MSDERRLMEMAAKAAGYRVTDVRAISARDIVLLNDAGGHDVWNPLTDDGDAFRLAVKLRLDIEFLNRGGEVVFVGGVFSELLDSHDPLSATRRAVVRVAAAIGEAMP